MAAEGRGAVTLGALKTDGTIPRVSSRLLTWGVKGGEGKAGYSQTLTSTRSSFASASPEMGSRAFSSAAQPNPRTQTRTEQQTWKISRQALLERARGLVCREGDGPMYFSMRLFSNRLPDFVEMTGCVGGVPETGGRREGVS